ncbi:tape measure protein [Rhodococcus sp. BH5]|uniref:tape measure protein n=1 Tax=Rhodococcus sp. BH5 TaxID=2871702 RepID=UPI0022CD2728|nr:tape measure protein [Rhodococcus sp. BH5]MCZ9634736.1 tape measure protein [Rhodococcus sp. BH5]
MSSGLSTALKAGVLTTGVAVGGLLAATLVKGMGRLTAIDTAEGKLRGLGHSTQSTAKIMDSALASVKGTAFGLGDAATVAASAVAAGIAPGKELTKYLSLTGDAATIAGSSLSEMGSIFNQVQASGTVYTDTLNQLSDRGIPILQWLQAEYGVTAEALAKMVKGGEVDSATFMKVISENIGGAALESGNTVVGAFENVKAAMGRLGAAALGPGFERLPGQMSSITTALDDTAKSVGPLAKAFDHLLFDVMLPENFDAGAFLSGVTTTVLNNSTSAINKFSAWVESDLPGLIDSGKAKISELFSLSGVDGSWDRLVGVFHTLVGVAKDAATPILGIATSLAAASGALGVSSWQLFLSALEAAATVADAVLVPALNGLSGLMAGNTMALAALAAGFLVFRTFPGLMARVTGAVAPMRAGITSAATSVATSTAGMRAGFTAMSSDMRRLAPQIGTVGAAMRTLGTHSSTIRSMQTSFMGASTAAGGFSAAARIAGGSALSGLKSGASAIAGVVGGPMNAALMVGAGLLISWFSNVQKAKANVDAYEKSLLNVAKARNDLTLALLSNGGNVDDSALTNLSNQVTEITGQFESLGKNDAKWNNVASDIFGDMFGLDGPDGDISGDMDRIAQANKDAKAAIDETGFSAERLAGIISGSQSDFDLFTSGLRESGTGGEMAAQKFEEARQNLLDIQEAARRVTPGMAEIAEQFNIMADGASSADQKSSALKRTLDILAGVPPDMQATMSAYNQLVRDVAKSTAEAMDKTAGFGQELLNADGSVNSSTENGAGLLKTLMGIRDATSDAAMAGGDMGKVFADNQAMFEQLATQAGVSVDEIRNAIGSLGYDQRIIQLSAVMEGGDQVTKDLGAIWSKLQVIKPGEPKVIEVAALTEDAQTRLNEMGFKVEQIKENGVTTFKVTADSEDAIIGLDAIVAKISQVGGISAVPKIDLDTTYFDLNEQKSQQLLDILNAQTATPGADLLIDKLLAGKDISVREISDLSQRIADPQVRLQIEQALRDAGIINAAITSAAQNRTSVITIDVQRTSAAQAAFNATGQYGPAAPQFNSRGSRLPKNSAGSRLPTSGPGTSTTDGILGIGYDGVPTSWVDKGEWIINGRSSEKYNGLLAAINRDDPRLNTLPKFAEGGRNGIDAALGAGRSVEGNKYVWGGTGPTGFDCSGFVGWLQQIVMGVVGSTKRLYTTYSILDGALAGLQPGLGPAGTQFQVGVSQEHMAATIAGQAAESGGAHGTSGIGGGRANAQHSQFPNKYHLPNSMIAGWNEAQGVTGGGTTSEVTWTDKQELDLQSAGIAVQQAKEARDKVYADEKKSEADRAQADIKVQQAEQKVIDLQAKKDEASTSTKKGPSPQAPGLAKAYSEEEMARLEAQMQVDDADERRNDVYADPEASANDRLRADIALQKAQEELAAVGKKKDSAAGDYSLKGILKSFATKALDAVFTGIEGQDYFGLTQSRWWSTDFASLIPEVDGVNASQSEIAGQLPVTPGTGNWVADLLRTGDFQSGSPVEEDNPAIAALLGARSLLADGDFTRNVRDATGLEEDSPIVQALLRAKGVKAPKVFDDGGWLMPGEMGINLSQRPEPIFNSPGQLQAFAGSALAPAKPTSIVHDNSITIGDVTTANVDDFARRMRLEQQKRVHGFTGG